MRKSSYVLALLLCSVVVFAQDKTGSLCVLTAASNGQTLTVRGKADRSMHDMLLVLPNCKDVAVLIYAGEEDALHSVSSTRVNLPRDTPVQDSANLKLQRDREFLAFEKYTNDVYKSTRKSICIGCYKYEVEATFTGRLDVTQKTGLIRDEKGQKIVGMDGFGHPIPFTRYRFVIESVANVTARKLPKPGTDQSNTSKSTGTIDPVAEGGNTSYGTGAADSHKVLVAQGTDSPSAPPIKVVIDNDQSTEIKKNPATVFAHELGEPTADVLNATESNVDRFTDAVNPKSKTSSEAAEKAATPCPKNQRRKKATQ